MSKDRFLTPDVYSSLERARSSDAAFTENQLHHSGRDHVRWFANGSGIPASFVKASPVQLLIPVLAKTEPTPLGVNFMIEIVLPLSLAA